MKGILIYLAIGAAWSLLSGVVQLARGVETYRNPLVWLVQLIAWPMGIYYAIEREYITRRR